MRKIFIGYDERQRMSYHVLAQSLVERASEPLAITALRLEQLPMKRRGLTPFTWSRFIVPFLCGFEGWALFMDADMIATSDIARVFDCADDRYAVMVRKTNHAPFEWASLMLFNCAHEANRVLTPQNIDANVVNGLHAIKWCAPEHVGELASEWNHCVGYDDPALGVQAHVLHYTQGVPMWPETEGGDNSSFWHKEFEEMHTAAEWKALMGKSVHAGHVYERLKKQNAG